ncbi:caspase-8 isoform X2 [Wyeomyia smithii]|uniref:caspase-8 isoform X2 n=1 Tax=Wyeomyia smithii TaxID=174621 RepID=UPI002468166B|nr:caspase-8 isoform X2 [Wyeomyia smithii]
MCSTIVSEDLDFIENELNFSDKISLFFLLYGHRNPQYLLQTLAVISKNLSEETHLLQDWISYVKDKWQSELLEALVIIQANLCLLKSGFDDVELKEQFLPFIAELATFVNPVLKSLYLLCEKLDDTITGKLHDYFKRDNGLVVQDRMHFELVLLDLICQGAVKLGCKKTGEQCDLLVLVAAFKTLDLYDLADFCKNIANNFNKGLTVNPNQSDNAKSATAFQQTPESKRQQFEDTPSDAETNPELAELLPLKPLCNRRGTEVDKLALLNLFSAFGYDLIETDNVPHVEILKQVENAVVQMRASHRSLVVCLLSHGQEGKVYGSNSIPVSVKAIEQAMAAEKLTGKPKLLFVQACQGSDLQSAVEIPRLEHDGPSAEKTASVYVDFLVAWSTVPGFASVRHIEKGSWFVQELCLKLRQLHVKDHLMDILTAVINDVSSKRGYGNECMVPIIKSTLRKKLYFEPLKDK